MKSRLTFSLSGFMLLWYKGDKPEGEAMSTTVDLTTEYQRILDLITKVKAFKVQGNRNSGYKTEEDLASQIFLQLFERKHWDKWDPSRMSLSSYTYLGVKSLVINERRSRDRKKAAADDFRDVSRVLVRSYRENDEEFSTDVVSNDFRPEADIEHKEFVQGFLKYLSEEGGHLVPTYAEAFKLLSQGYTASDLREVFFPAEAYPSLDIKKIIRDLKSLVRSYNAWVDAQPVRAYLA